MFAPERRKSDIYEPGKAVKPTTVYGATKLLAERLLTSLTEAGEPGNDIRKCKFWQRTGLSRLDFSSV